LISTPRKHHIMPAMESKPRRTFIGGSKGLNYRHDEVVTGAMHDPSAYRHRRYPATEVPLPAPTPAPVAAAPAAAKPARPTKRKAK
jgi:hypothetical protein